MGRILVSECKWIQHSAEFWNSFTGGPNLIGILLGTKQGRYNLEKRGQTV